MLDRFFREVGTTVEASIRQGAKEVAQIIPAFPESVKTIEELGVPGNPTPYSISVDQGLFESHRSLENAPRFEPEIDMAMEQEREPEME